MLLAVEGLRRLCGTGSLPAVDLDALPDVFMGGGPVGGRFLGRERLGRTGEGAELFAAGGEAIAKVKSSGQEVMFCFNDDRCWLS